MLGILCKDKWDLECVDMVIDIGFVHAWHSS